MVPEDATELEDVFDFEIAHHPDRRPHEVYATANAVLEGLDEGRTYLAALEPDEPDIAVRLSMAEALRLEQQWDDAGRVLEEVLSSPSVSDQPLLVSVFTLLADIKCEGGDCDAARDVLENGTQRFPGAEPIRDALERLD